MGRPRAFDETEAVQAAAALFARRAFDGVSVDDLVSHLGVHRNSLYQVFGSKRGLYLRALRWSLQHQVRPLLGAPPAVLAAEPALDLLLMAATERAPEDPEVAQEVGAILAELDTARGGGPDTTATLLGMRLRARVTREG
ncbi:TetR family transcriptional regulator [Actinoplanes oblitus]|uniref:TetR family transcriptional regulator n=1 Tax=Actinoplanes oblitus TaxID=3040509 RepID=A0ABY8W5J4_9ACTN|nr:TetR family transcriptional regulator [Actinoplanes oblitus]WIM92612.1 TetR family transcriptional regulator [Actinoplanes oblitus]